MLKKSRSESGLFHPRIFLASVLFSAGICLATFSFSGEHESNRSVAAPEPERYMPVPGGEPDDLDRIELEWNSRLTYPTGVFDPAWVRRAAQQDSLMARQVPAGLQREMRNDGPAALNPNAFTALGPQPLIMTGCSGCFDYTRTEGRVNA